MKTFTLASALVLSQAAAEKASPIQKVLTMLADLEGKVKAEGAAEDKSYEKYAKFCDKAKRDTGYEIKTGDTSVEELTATIEKASADIETSSKRAEELSSTIQKAEQDIQQATDVNNKEQADYKASLSELKGSIDMLGKAIKVLGDKLKGSALLQQQVSGKQEHLLKALTTVVNAAAMPTVDKNSLMSFVESATSQAPAAPVYTSKSNGILDLLGDMKDKARSELNDVESQAAQNLHSFKMLRQSLEAQLSADKQEMQEVTAQKTDAAETKAGAETTLGVTTKDLEADKKALAEYEASCTQADTGYAASKKSRAEELEALKKAADVIKEKTGNADASQYKEAPSFAQISMHADSDHAGDQYAAADILRRLADKSKSSDISKLATNVESLVQTGVGSGKDVFAEIKKVIAKMVKDKKEQAAADATKKAYCDTEKAKTKEKLDELTSNHEKLSANIDKKTSEAATLKSDSETLAQELTDLVKLQAEMDDTRQEERANFATNKKDLTDGLEGVRMALDVLRDYYQGTPEGEASLVQVDPPQFGHAKDTGASTGIIGMIEVVESDFSRSLVTSESEEEQKEEEYQKITDQNKEIKIQKTADQRYKAQTSVAITQALQEKISDNEAVQEELAAVNKYKASLDEQCLESGMSYEEKVAARDAEIAGLKEALKTIGGTDLTASLLQVRGLRGAVMRHNW
eukprot:TRINITY_DN290_c0_g2_i1.p1 TRINITY_DN290_c0_g2~~TRINITY_DN290_c0_g2_i1.p1  ORF type:complete len:692 (+),score=277.94 TRINITY_DN290_c0_g2_i1:102-2177(+)